ncbi:MAG: hypothetical protein DKINENOH_01653 [bacterium]|nr:hypothetical protein [bacterium]
MLKLLVSASVPGGCVVQPPQFDWRNYANRGHIFK